MINLRKSAVSIMSVLIIGCLLMPTTQAKRGVELNKSKTGLLTEVQKKNLEQRAQDVRKNQTARKAKSLMQKYKTDRNATRTAVKDQLKNKNLSNKDKKVLKNKLKSNRSDLKAINDELKKDLKKELGKQFTTQERGMLAQVEPNFIYELQAFDPNDPEFSNQWGLQSVGIEGIPMATDPGTDPIIVAVIDGGVDFTHQDLVVSKWTSNNCVDDENVLIPGGCNDGGFDTVDEDTDPYPSDGITHGTAVASVIAAETGNGVGMASVGQNNVQIMSIRACCTAEGFFTVQDIDEAIRFAVNNGADLINASFGGPTWSQQLQEAIQYALDNGVMVVAAAGNYGVDNDVDPMYPANFNQTHPNVLSVGATTSWDHLAYFSNYGDQTVDIAGPGQSVITAAPNSNYQTISGTSFSTPLTTGVLAQMMRGSDLDFLNTKNLLLASVETLPALQGLINNSKALRFTVVEELPEPTDPNPVDPDPVDPDPIDPDPTDPDPEPEEPDPEPDPQSNPQCGNGVLEASEGEQCDDGNLSNGDGCSAICSIESSGSGGGGNIFVSSSTTGDLIFHHEDHLTGSSVDTDSTGAVVQLFDYYAFGDTRIDEHSVDYQNDYQFTGKERDSETSLLYYESRYYDSSIGRFTTIDPWAGDLTDPQTLNKYTYVNNNPVKYVDPSGNIFVLALAAPAAPTITASVASLSLTTLAAALTVVGKLNTPNNTSSPALLPQRNPVTNPAELRVGIGNTSVSGNINPGITTQNIPSLNFGIRTTSVEENRSLPLFGPPDTTGLKWENGAIGQSRTWDSQGNPTKDIDFTDHGTPKVHDSPHQHKWTPRPDGTYNNESRGSGESLETPESSIPNN